VMHMNGRYLQLRPMLPCSHQQRQQHHGVEPAAQPYFKAERPDNLSGQQANSSFSRSGCIFLETPITHQAIETLLE
jgi:hypothetical protein